MIGFLGGTCIAFFVVMGDLAPPIIAGYLGIENSERLRIGVILGKHDLYNIVMYFQCISQALVKHQMISVMYFRCWPSCRVTFITT